MSAHSAEAPLRGGAETRRSLLAAAADVIAEKGYERSTLAEIAARAGLTTGAVYSTYGSKYALLRAVISAMRNGLAFFDDERSEGLDRDIDRLAARLCEAITDTRARQLGVLQLELILLALRTPELAADLTVSGNEDRALLVAQLRERGVTDPERVAVSWVGAVQGLQLQQLFEPGSLQAEDYARVLRGLLS